MNPDIIVAIIAASGGLVGTVVGIRMNTSLVVYRLNQLEKKVEIHNKVIDRTYCLEEKAALSEEKFKVVNHRLEDLENGKGKE
jgi:hypothetical protein